MKKQKKKGMSREDAAELYRDLKKTMSGVKTGTKAVDDSRASLAKEIAASIKQGLAAQPEEQDISGFTPSSSRPSAGSPSQTNVPSPEETAVPLPSWFNTPTPAPTSSGFNGHLAAIIFVLVFAGSKAVLSGLEAAGFGKVESAQAAMSPVRARTMMPGEQFSKEEVHLLTKLDQRRKELAERGEKLDEKSLLLDRRDKEFAAKLTRLRELTEDLKVEREQTDRKKREQLEQLSNVYGSMNPSESAQLMEQLDVTIALSLLQRMPEKRIGQILSLMSPERALTITRMLSGSKADY